jgi:NTE family protein
VAGRLADLDVRTFGDLRITDDPHSALPPERAYKLVVIVSDVSTNRMLRLPWDCHMLGIDPDDMPVAHAVRASASIPFFFEPVIVHRLGHRHPIYLTDGGMLSNFPIDVFDRRDGKPARWPTFGVKLSARPSAKRGSECPDIRGPIELVKALIATMVSAHDQMYLDDPSVVDRTIFVDTSHVSSTNFDIDEAAQQRLFDNGVQAAEKFLASWSFDAYLERYRSQP